MGEFFLTIVNMSISASWIVLAVLILRLLLKKAPKWITVLLWGIVAVRLICPFSIESVLSLIPSTEAINPDILVEQAPVMDPDFPVIDGVENPGIIGGGSPVIGDDPIVGGDPVTGEPSAPTPDTTPANPAQIVIPVLSYVWLAGIAGMLAYTVISYIRVKGKVGTAVRLRDNIFQSNSVVSPFVLGLIKPKIYLPFGMDGQDMDYVIAHENAHIRRKDHWWKPVGFLILTLHWFNPLLWLGYVLLCRDIELACDEKVIKELDFQQKADYSQALLNCSVNRRIIAACPLAFGEVGVKDRVKSVLNYKKPAFWIIVVAIVASIVTAVCFLTDPVKDKNDTEQFFSEGFLLFDIGAESMESIESCTIIHDGNPTELILSEEDTLLFTRYAYTDKVPVPELSEVFLYPKTKRIKVVVGDRSVMLYLMQDGSIVVNHTGESFRVYQAEEQDVITPEKYAQLVAKYATEPTTPNQSAAYDKAVAAYYAFLNHQITAIAEDNSKFFVSSYSSISNGQSGFDRYALHDVNGDGIPELFIDASHDHILAFDGENIRQWYSSMSWMGIQLLSNGAVVDTHSGAGSFINYLTFGPNGIEKFISFSGGPGGESTPYYYGEGKSESSQLVSKDQWETLTKPYFQQMENKVELDWQTTVPTTPSKGETIQVAEPFASVLNNKKIFFFENKGKSVFLSDYYERIWKLASVDIDHDGNKEIAVMFGAGDGTLILWQHGGSVFGYEFGFRALYRINKDGTFLWNTNSGNIYGCSSIAFVGTEVKTTELWRVENNDGSFTNYIDNKPVSQEQMNAFPQYRNLEEVEWTVLGSNTTIVGTVEEWKEPEDPYAIREITDERVVKSGDKKLFNNGQFTLRFPTSWKCFTASGEDNVVYYFQDSVIGEKCQLSVNVTFSAYRYDRTWDQYMEYLSASYEDVVIESLATETIRGYACTKVVYSYTEDNTKFIGVWYDNLIEGLRLYDFRIAYPAEEKETYETVFAYVLESIQFITADNGSISSLPLKEAYDYAVKMYVAGPSSKYRDVGDLQLETGQIIEIDGKYYQSFVASNVDIRYIWISQAEFPDNKTAQWDWYTVGSSRVYSLDLLGKIDEGRKGDETDQIDPDDIGLLSVVYNNSPFITQKGTTVSLKEYKPFYKRPEETTYYETGNVFVPQEYTFVDLDKDGKKELIVAEAPYADTYLILREENGKIYGYSLPKRWFQSLKKDGSFQSSGGALIHDYNTISFSQNTYQISTIAKFYFEGDTKKPVADKYGYAPDYEKSVFEINGKSVSFEQIKQFAEEWDNRPGAVWIKFT